jgi:ketosteroid isomerase-like protein
MNEQIVYDFAEAINRQNIEKIYSLMSNDHTFIDAQGDKVEGKHKMRAGWEGYFQMFPDYKIEITSIFEDGDTIAAFGFAGGTYKGLKTENNENHWRLPAAWKAVVIDGKIYLWQVYADTKVVFDIIGRNK